MNARKSTKDRKIELTARYTTLQHELVEIERELQELGGDLYDDLFLEYETKMGVRMRSSWARRKVKSETNPRRISIVDYLLGNDVTIQNPVSVYQLAKNLEIKINHVRVALDDGHRYGTFSPIVAGVLEHLTAFSMNGNYSGKNSKVYIKDLPKARTYLDIMRRAVELP